MKSVVISSGHGSLVQGANGFLNEVDEARRIVDLVAEKLRGRDVIVETFHDDTSTTQNQNLETIVRFHNSKSRQLDISVHLNAYMTTASPMGTECLYKSQSTLAAQMSSAMAEAGRFINRGPKKRTDLYFLNQTAMPAILLEICFVDSSADADLYDGHFEEICDAITMVIHPEGKEVEDLVHPPLFTATGKCSYFGGPNDEGVAADEGLAFCYRVEDKPELFLPYQPEGTTGLARRLNPYVGYCACRWDYMTTPTELLLTKRALIRAEHGRETLAFPADWGPHSVPNRVVDLSPVIMEDLDLQTDDTVEVIFPAPED